jgi:hypothetical protein
MLDRKSPLVFAFSFVMALDHSMLELRLSALSQCVIFKSLIYFVYRLLLLQYVDFLSCLVLLDFCEACFDLLVGFVNVVGCFGLVWF